MRDADRRISLLRIGPQSWIVSGCLSIDVWVLILRHFSRVIVVGLPSYLLSTRESSSLTAVRVISLRPSIHICGWNAITQHTWRLISAPASGHQAFICARCLRRILKQGVLRLSHMILVVLIVVVKLWLWLLLMLRYIGVLGRTTCSTTTSIWGASCPIIHQYSI